MHEVALDLLILLAGIWLVAVTLRPLGLPTVMGEKVDIIARTHGGGMTGQAGSLVLGIARALERMDPELRSVLREHGMLTRDSRMVERKKYGKAGARRSFQFSKR